MLTGLRNRLRQFGALTPWARRSMLVASTALPPLHLGVRLFGLRRVLTWMQAFPPGARPPTRPAVRDTVQGVAIACRHGFGRASCLTGSLVLQWLLRRQGVSSELRIGVRLVDGRLHAHAWVELDGRPLNDTAQSIAHFEPMPLTAVDAARWT